MDLRSLMCFVAVAEELNFRQAADRVHLGQPGLSKVVAKLERQVGVKLLDRSTTHVELTPAGKAFLQHARSIMASMEAAVRVANDAGPSPSSQLRVGLSEWTEQFVPQALHAFRQVAPDIHLEVGQVETGSAVAVVRDDRFDVVFSRSVPRDTRVDAELLAHEALVAAIPAGHPLACPEPLDLASLANEPLVLYPRAFAPASHDQIVDLCVRAGFQPYIAYETVPLSPMAALVAAGSGIALVPESIVPRFDASLVVCRRFDGEAPTMPVVLVWRHGNDSAVVRRLSEVASEALATVTN